jgi:hypothetical protein
MSAAAFRRTSSRSTKPRTSTHAPEFASSSAFSRVLRPVASDSKAVALQRTARACGPGRSPRTVGPGPGGDPAEGPAVFFTAYLRTGVSQFLGRCCPGGVTAEASPSTSPPADRRGHDPHDPRPRLTSAAPALPAARPALRSAPSTPRREPSPTSSMPHPDGSTQRAAVSWPGSRVSYGVRVPRPPRIGACGPQPPNDRGRPAGHGGHNPRRAGLVCHNPQTAMPPGACSQLLVRPCTWPRSPDDALTWPDDCEIYPRPL